MQLISITPDGTGQYDVHVYKRPHSRVSRDLNASGVILPFVASISGKRHLCGTDLRCHHFSKAFSRTPISRAADLTRFQSSCAMSSTNTDVSSVLQHPIGGGTDFLAVLPLGMTKKETERERQMRFKAQFKREREARGWSQQYLGDLLGIGKANYEKYEGPPDKDGKIRKFPIGVIIDFTRLISADLDFFLTAEQLTKRRKKIG